MAFSLAKKASSAKPAVAAAAINVILSGYPFGETIYQHWDKATHLFYGSIFLANTMILMALAIHPLHDFLFRPATAPDNGE